MLITFGYFLLNKKRCRQTQIIKKTLLISLIFVYNMSIMTKKNIFQLSLIFLISFIFSSCINKDPIADKKELQSRINARSSVEYRNIYVENRENKLNEYISNLNLAQKIAQLIIINQQD